MKLVSVLVAATSLGAATAATSNNNNFRGSGKSNYSRQLEYDATSTTDQSTSVGQTLMYLLANFVMMPMDMSGRGCPKPHPKKKSGGSSGGHSSWSSGSGGSSWNDGSRRSLSENDWNGGGDWSGGDSSWSSHSSSGSSSKKKPPPPRCEHPHAPAPKKKSSSKSHSSGWNDDGHGWDNDGYNSSQNSYYDSKESWSFVGASLLASAAIGAAGFAAKNKCKGGGMFPSQGSDKPANDDSMDNETVDSDMYEPSPSTYVEMTDPSTQQLRVSIPPPPQPQQSSKFGNLSKKIRSITIMKK